jgi:hypothetical protein
LPALRRRIGISGIGIYPETQLARQAVAQWLENIYLEGELNQMATCKEFLKVQTEGGRKVERKRKCYNLDAIISVGYGRIK